MTFLPGAEVANFMSHLDNFLENTVVELLVNVHVGNSSTGRSNSGVIWKNCSYERDGITFISGTWWKGNN